MRIMITIRNIKKLIKMLSKAQKRVRIMKIIRRLKRAVMTRTMS